MRSSNFKKILLFGGSFDPVHQGHLKILAAAEKKINPDWTFIVPSFQSPLKSRILTPFLHRLKMLEIAFKDWKKLSIDEFEIKQNQKTYWIETIDYFLNKYPQTEIYFLIGSDQLINFKQWKKYDEILKKAKIVCYKREHYCCCCKNIALCGCKSSSNDKDLHDIIYINDELYHISSTQIRKRPLKEMVIEGVIDYINDHGLYACERIERMCKPSRYQHCLRVAYYASELMKNIDPKQVYLAYTAGIYHDMCKDMDECEQVEISEMILNIKEYPSWRVLHGHVGAFILEVDFLFKNQYVLNAIRRHTRPYDYHNDPLTVLDKVLYLADKLEPLRTNDDVLGRDIEYFRKLAKTDYENCFDELYALNQQGYQ